MKKDQAVILMVGVGTVLFSSFAMARAGAAVDFPDNTDQIVVKFDENDGIEETGVLEKERKLDVINKTLGKKLGLQRIMTDSTFVLKLPSSLPLSAVREITTRIAKLPGVAHAEPDPHVYPMRVPNDPQYAAQWHYAATAGGTSFPAAWDISTGSGYGNIAILDTGILAHSDLAGRTFTGYDFISDALVANDGNGRDANPADPGNWVSYTDRQSPAFSNCKVQDSDWHGTHVAGLIAASTNNGAGVAGSNWGSKILPIRVLGKCRGYVSDIVDGLSWASGLSVTGVPNNTTPTKVFNLSLGGAGGCPVNLQNAIDNIIARGGVIVVAAGNESTNAQNTQPANCKGVVVVAATNNVGGLAASYSNYGSHISLSAPGGEGVASGAILSTGDYGAKSPLNDHAYVRMSGTSMAAPLVTGAASLMLSVNPKLNGLWAANILRQTARDFPTGTGSDCTTASCGAGILRASSAVRAAYSAIAGSVYNSVALSANGTVWAWGNAEQRQTAGECYLERYCVYPALVKSGGSTFTGVRGVALGINHTLALRTDGTVWAWGTNFNGQLGPNVPIGSNTSSPVRIPSLSGVKTVAATIDNGWALKNDGTVWGWGTNTYGQLGLGTFSNAPQATPVQVPGLTEIIAIFPGDYHSFAIRRDGAVFAWGYNYYGGFGNGVTDRENVHKPFAVNNLRGMVKLQAGRDFVIGLKANGSVWSWGANSVGQLGSGTTSAEFRTTPAPVAGLSGINEISAGKDHSLAIAKDGSIFSWGGNRGGKTGNGTVTASVPTPSKVVASSKIIHVAAGVDHSMAVTATGHVKAWGYNDWPVVGNGTKANQYSTMQSTKNANGSLFYLY